MPRNRFAIATEPVAVCLAADAPSSVWHLLLPAGGFQARDGRGPFTVGDRADMDRIVAATRRRARTTELMVDYDHQSMIAPKVGGTAPAAGWIKELEVRESGIYGRIEWLAATAAAIRRGRYRYLSPVFLPDKSGRVQLLISVALTNTPAIDLQAVAASALIDTGEPMDKIAQALGLAADASEAAILAAIGTFTAFRTNAAAAVALAATATDTEIVAAVQAARGTQPDPRRFVPAEQVVQLQTQLAELQKGIATDKAAEAVDKAIAAGKLAPALKEWGLARAQADLADFEAFVAKSPVLVAPGGRMAAKAAPTTEAVTLDESDIQAMRALGLTEAQMLASKKSQLETA